MSLARATLLADWRTRIAHFADECQLEQCGYCGCCVHGKTVEIGCKVDSAPVGMRCASVSCGCEGKS